MACMEIRATRGKGPLKEMKVNKNVIYYVKRPCRSLKNTKKKKMRILYTILSVLYTPHPQNLGIKGHLNPHYRE